MLKEKEGWEGIKVVIVDILAGGHISFPFCSALRPGPVSELPQLPAPVANLHDIVFYPPLGMAHFV